LIDYLKRIDWWVVVFFIWFIQGFDFLYETKDDTTKVSVEKKQENKVEKAVDKNEIKTDW
jgi:hypothetical protein